MSDIGAREESSGEWSNGGSASSDGDGDRPPSSPARGPAEGRLIRLMEEFRTRQRTCPDLAVRPWWTSGVGAPGGRLAERRGAVGFVVEYCPLGVESVELAVRPDRVRAEGPTGLREARLELTDGWLLEGEDVECPELMVNHLLALADRLLDEAA